MLSNVKNKATQMGQGADAASAAPSARLPSAVPMRSALALLVGALYTLPALADFSDTIKPFVSASIVHDDNLRRQDDAPSGQNIDYADTYKQVDAGVLLERPIGRQLLTAKAKFSRVSFDRYRQFDYNAEDVSGALKWQVGNHVSGTVSGRYKQSLAPFADNVSIERNLREEKRSFADINWLFHPSWQVHGSVLRERFSYDIRPVDNRNEDTLELGADYLASSGSRIGLLLRHLKGESPNQVLGAGSLFDSSYDQNEVKVDVYWALSGTTNAVFVGGWAQRKHPVLSSRDDSGVNGRGIINWAPLGKLRFTGVVWREFGSSENSKTNSALTKGASIGFVWDASAKIGVNGELKTDKRDFIPFKELTAAELNQLSDTTRTASLGLSYKPTLKTMLGVSANHDVRSGSRTAGTNSYHANSVSFNASAQF